MPHCSSAMLSKEKVPQHAQFQAAITATGFDLQLDEYYQPFTAEGYIPCKLNGVNSGFELLWEPAEGLLAEWPVLADRVKASDISMTFVMHGDMRECACVIIASLALLESLGATIFYQDDEMLSTAEELREELVDVMKEL